MTDAAALLATLLQANQLKQTPRTGWIQRGVPEPESVASHSFGVAFVAFALAQAVEETIDVGRLLTMAILHDLPEALTTDIPTPAWRRLPEGAKSAVEGEAMKEILAGASFGEQAMAMWEELKAGETAEAHLVQDADRLELLLQAFVYEQQSGNRRLAEFWQTPADFHFAESRAVYEEIRRRRGVDLQEGSGRAQT